MKQNKIEQLGKKHELEIEALQNSCKHKKHHRIAYMWAPGHFGNDVEMCDECGKVLKNYNNVGISIR